MGVNIKSLRLEVLLKLAGHDHQNKSEQDSKRRDNEIGVYATGDGQIYYPRHNQYRHSKALGPVIDVPRFIATAPTP